MEVMTDRASAVRCLKDREAKGKKQMLEQSTAETWYKNTLSFPHMHTPSFLPVLSISQLPLPCLLYLACQLLPLPRLLYPPLRLLAQGHVVCHWSVWEWCDNRSKDDVARVIHCQVSPLTEARVQHEELHGGADEHAGGHEAGHDAQEGALRVWVG